VQCKLIGEFIAEYKGKPTGTRILADGKIESSYTGMGKLLGKDATLMATVVFWQVPTGVNMIEGNGMESTAEGETVMHKFSGIGLSTGNGWKSSNRGAVYFMTSSPKLASLNKIVGVWEWESDENGDFSVKVWAWK
jgi:hypothetical protein